MADSLLNIGGEPTLLTPFDWGSVPKSEIVITRYLQQFPGTVTLLGELNTYAPISFEVLYVMYTKQTEYTFLEFIHTQLGRNIRFWVPYQKQLFKLYSDAAVGGNTLEMYANNFDLVYQGYERIYIKMVNGDLLTRQISGASSIDDTVMQIILTDVIDRDITTTNYVEMGRFLLVRFSDDNFPLKVETDQVSTI